MGASGWEYVTPFKGTVEESLEALHAKVFGASRSRRAGGETDPWSWAGHPVHWTLSPDLSHTL
ncbi:hypothetical protein [Streptomyces sp. NPDC046942]|uniref:hypothetical protein n=1 Tax=Streptomyces sp. NPDC046942 TaxID=3155137 RepID=UPI0033D2B553